MNRTRGRRRRMTAAQAIVQYLQVQWSERDGVDQRLIPAVFGIFGHGNVAGLGQALREHGRDLPFYQPFHEQAMVHTAIGYARATRRLATLACTASIGPGSTNMVTGAATATVNRLPVLLLASDYYANRRQGPVLQQLEHPVSRDVSVNDSLRPVSRFFDRITRPEQLLEALPEAMRVLLDPVATGAVTLCLPQDMQTEAFEVPAGFLERRTWSVDRVRASTEPLRRAAEMLQRARRPLVLAGGGVRFSAAEAEVIALCRDLGLPVAETYAGKGMLAADYEMHLGGIGITGTGAANAAAGEADLVLAIGTRLTDCVTGSRTAFQDPDVRFVHINVDGRDAAKEGGLAVVADAREAVRDLRRVARSLEVATSRRYRAHIARLRADWQTRVAAVAREGDGALTQAGVALVLDESLGPRDTVLSSAGTQLAAAHMLGGSNGTDYHLDFGYSCMGHELPAAFGLRLAGHTGQVVVYVGDGTYLMNPTELLTAAQEGWEITVVLAENHGYQSIRQLQMGRDGRPFGTEFRRRSGRSGRLDGPYVKVDLAANAASLGARTWRVDSAASLRAALVEAGDTAGVKVIVAEVAADDGLPDAGSWWDISAAEVSGDPVTRARRAEYERGRRRQRRFDHREVA